MQSNTNRIFVPDEQSRAEAEAKELFKHNSVEDIKTKEANTRKEIEDKKQELRRLVGVRYRDLIDSADSIIQMREFALKLDSKVHDMEELCAILRKKRKREQSTDKKETAKDQQKDLQRNQYYLGLQIKLLVDTPEQIWSSLENSEFLTATVLYLKAEKINKKNNNANDPWAKKITSSIPLLSRQWATITQFPPKITAGSRSHLLKNHLHVNDYAGALASLILIDNKTNSQVFLEFLNTRSKALRSLLNNGVSDIQETFCDVARIIYSSLKHVNQIFYHNKENEPPLLNLLLNPIFASEDVSINVKSIEVLPMEQIRELCKEWMREVTAIVGNDGKVLLGNVGKAKDLRTIIDSVWSVIQEELFPPPLPPVSSAKSFSGNISYLFETEKETVNSKEEEPEIYWEELSTLLLGETVNLWPTLFENLFLERGKQIISQALEKLTISSPLEQCLQQIQKEELSTENNVGSYIWSNQEEEKIEITKKKAQGVTFNQDKIIQYFDSQFSIILQDVNHLLTISDVTGTADVKLINSLKPYVTLLPKYHTYLQRTCHSRISEIASNLENKLKSFSIPSTEISRQNMENTLLNFSKINPKACLVLDQILFIGRVSKSIYSDSQCLKKLLNEPTPSVVIPSPSTTPKTPRARFLATPKKIVKEENSQLFKQVQQMLRQQYQFAHSIWAEKIVKDLGGYLRETVLHDNWNYAGRSKSWEEVTVTVESEENKNVEDKLYIPNQPSSYLLNFLFTLCNEIHRIGGHVVDKSVLYFLVHEMSERVYEMYGELVGKKEEFPRNKEGVIQLLFDMRFMFDVLSGRAEMRGAENDYLQQIIQSRNPSDVNEDILDQKRKWNKKTSSLEETLEAELDPIDLLFYQPHLKQSVQKCYKRCIVLFGSLTQLNRLYTSAKPSTSQEQPNVLVLATPVTRFTLLPVSTPPLKSAPIIAAPTTPGVIEGTANRVGPASKPGTPQPLKQQSFVGKIGSMFVGSEKKDAQSGWFFTN